MTMNIKNYTSEVPASRSINDIENVLIKMGASRIAKEYKDGKIVAISFSISSPLGEGIVPFLLPAKVDALAKLFEDSYKSTPTKAQAERCYDQAERTAWKNVKEWVELQATMIKLQQVEFMEVFMPYIYNLSKGQTLYQIAKENNYQKLLN